MNEFKLCDDCSNRLLSEEEAIEASNMTRDEVLEEGINDLIQIAYANDLTDDHINDVLERVLDKRAKDRRSGFRFV